MGKLSRTKGHSFERSVAHQFTEIGFPEARRQLEYHVKDALGVDLQCTEPFAVQCKRGRQYAPITAIEEIQLIRPFYGYIPGEKTLGQIPLLITKADNKPAMAVLPWEELRRMIKQLYAE